MALVVKGSPVGVDVPITKLQSKLYDSLVTNGDWTNYESYHRAYKNEYKGLIKPEAFVTNNDYKGVLMDDGFTVTSFFIADNARPPADKGRHVSTVSVIFQVDLKKLYPSSPHRFDEEFINEVEAVINTMNAGFTLTSIKTGIDDVYAEFDTSTIKKDLHDMQPYFVCRFDIEVNYIYKCNPVFATTGTCTLAVTVSTTEESYAGAGDGTATANVTGAQGVITYLWTTSDGSIPSGEEVKQTATGLSAGTYNVLVTDNITAGCTAQDSGEVIVTPENELLFDGVNDKVLLTTQINVGVSEDYTLSFQVKFAATSSGGMVIISGLALNRYVGFNLDTNIFFVRNETQQRNFSFPSITTGIRYNCVVSRISDTIRVYMQGVESTTGGISDGGATNYTGISQYINSEVDGNLSNLGIKTGTGATPANVASLNANPQNFVSIMGGADLFYRFNESGATVTAPDTSGNSNTGTLTNFIFTPSPWVLKV